MCQSLEKLKKECLEFTKQISKDEEVFFNLTDAAQISSYVFCNGATFSPKTSTQYIRGYIEGIRETLGSYLVRILLVEENIENIEKFSQYHVFMQQKIDNEKTSEASDDYEFGELVGRKDAREFIRRRYECSF